MKRPTRQGLLFYLAVIAASALIAGVLWSVVALRDRTSTAERTLGQQRQVIDALAHQVRALGATPVAVVPSPGQRGATGARGVQGFIGPVGPRGIPGPTGSPGPTGQTGPAGATGDRGAQGAPGETGPRGPQGDTGPEPESFSWTDKSGRTYTCRDSDSNGTYTCTSSK